MIAANEPGLVQRIREDLSISLDIPIDQIVVRSLSVGSLIVDIAISRNASQFIPDALINSFIFSAPFSNTIPLYFSESGAINETIQVVTAFAYVFSGVKPPADRPTCDNVCIGIIAGAASGGVVLLCVLVWCCVRYRRNKRRKEEEAREPCPTIRPPPSRFPPVGFYHWDDADHNEDEEGEERPRGSRRARSFAEDVINGEDGAVNLSSAAAEKYEWVDEQVSSENGGTRGIDIAGEEEENWLETEVQDESGAYLEEEEYEEEEEEEEEEQQHQLDAASEDDFQAARRLQQQQQQRRWSSTYRSPFVSGEPFGRPSFTRAEASTEDYDDVDNLTAAGTPVNPRRRESSRAFEPFPPPSRRDSSHDWGETDGGAVLPTRRIPAPPRVRPPAPPVPAQPTDDVFTVVHVDDF